MMNLHRIALIVLAACGAPRSVTTPASSPTPAPVPPPAVVAPVEPELTLDGAWTIEQTQPLVDKMQTVILAPDLAHLTAGEKAAVAKLLEVGAIMQELYEDQRHIDAPASRALLAKLDGAGGVGREAQLKALYRVSLGPIVNTLENKRVPFLGVRPAAPGKTVYPWAIEASELDAFLAANPSRREELLAPRSVVRRADSVVADLATLDRHPVVDALHPGLRARIQAVQTGLYAVPYSVAYADRLVRTHGLLHQAADAVRADDAELAGYLRNRARDLLSDDYESGDAAWVTGTFKNLNVQIGAYESYDDELHGAKTFFSMSVLARRPSDSEAVRAALGDLQKFESSLPYRQHRKVRDRIPVGVYDVIADFGQARGGNTATILPNDASIARRHGRTILLRANIMRDRTLFDGVEGSWRAAMAPAHAKELTSDASFQRTLWHEIGHYLGVDRAADGRSLDDALGDTSDLIEEMKADLVALFVAKGLRAKGYYDDAKLRAVYASGIRRVLQNNRPRRDQPYQTMQLVQWNFFLEKGLLRFDAASGQLAVNYRRYNVSSASSSDACSRSSPPATRWPRRSSWRSTPAGTRSCTT